MSFNPSFAVVLDGGLVQYIIVQDWPRHLALPAFAVVDYDTEGAADDEITHVSVGNTELEAICRSELPEVFDSDSRALSPRAVLAALNEPVSERVPEPLALAHALRQSLLDLDGRINATEQAPTGDDYNELHALAITGLIDLLKALGDSADFGN